MEREFFGGYRESVMLFGCFILQLFFIRKAFMDLSYWRRFDGAFIWEIGDTGERAFRDWAVDGDFAGATRETWKQNFGGWAFDELSPAK